MNAPTHLEDLTTRIKPRTASNLLLWFIVAFVVVFFVWAAFTELDRTVRGMGRVIPSSQLQVVSNLEGGVVQDILVRSGQQVRPGDELIRLDPTQTGAEFGSGEATLIALDMKIARLQAEITGREPVYPAARNALAADQIRIEQALHASRMADLDAITAAARARLGQAERAVAEAQSTYRRAAPPMRRGARKRGSCGRWSSAASSRGSAWSRRRAGRHRAKRGRSRQRQPRPRPSAVAEARASWPSCGRNGAPPPPTSSPPPRPNAPRASARCRRSPTGSRAPCCARRCPAGSTASSSPPAAARSAPASRWSRSSRPTRAC